MDDYGTCWHPELEITGYYRGSGLALLRCHRCFARVRLPLTQLWRIARRITNRHEWSRL